LSIVPKWGDNIAIAPHTTVVMKKMLVSGGSWTLDLAIESFLRSEALVAGTQLFCVLFWFGSATMGVRALPTWPRQLATADEQRQLLGLRHMPRARERRSSAAHKRSGAGLLSQ
jgi:hypothetical protein